MNKQDTNEQTSTMTSPNLALEEYKEALAYLRHFDQLGWTILGLSITGALGLWAYTFKDLPFFSGKALALAGLGAAVLALGRLMTRRLTGYTRSHWNRAKQLETTLGFKLMSEMHERMDSTRAPRINVILDLIGISVIAGWLVYLVAFIFRPR